MRDANYSLRSVLVGIRFLDLETKEVPKWQNFPCLALSMYATSFYFIALVLACSRMHIHACPSKMLPKLGGLNGWHAHAEQPGV